MVRRILVAVCFAACGLYARGDERFTIERIEIRNAQHIAPEVLVAESLLRAGSEVSEKDVRAAVRRLPRLNFVLAADYLLERGSDDARRVVVIDVRENHRLWFLLDGRFVQEYEPIDALDYDYPDPTSDWKHAAFAARWGFRDGSDAHFVLTVLRNRHLFGRKNYSAYELGYTRRQLLNTPLFATAIVRSPVDSLEEGTFTPEVVIGLPLTADQTLTLEFEDTSFQKGSRRIGGTEFSNAHSERMISAAWTLDTRNEPYTPMSGTFLKLEPYIWTGDRDSALQRPPRFEFEAVSYHSKATGIDLTAERHWQLSEVSALSAGVHAGWARVEEDNPNVVPSKSSRGSSFEVIEAGYARRIWRSYVELEGRYILRDDERLRDDLETEYEVSAAWARRYRWGALRVGFAYTPGG